jgi:pilus assembly protein Flp/PilA
MDTLRLLLPDKWMWLRTCRAQSGKIWRDRCAQDLVEYSLMAGFVAVAAGAIMPNVSNSISVIFSKIASMLNSI